MMRIEVVLYFMTSMYLVLYKLALIKNLPSDQPKRLTKISPVDEIIVQFGPVDLAPNDFKKLLCVPFMIKNKDKSSKN